MKSRIFLGKHKQIVFEQYLINFGAVKSLRKNVETLLRGIYASFAKFLQINAFWGTFCSHCYNREPNENS